MNITCHNCKTKLNIPEDKIPKNRDASVSCPKCSVKLVIPASKSLEQSIKADESTPRLLFEDRLNALVCVGDPELQKKTYQTLRQIGFDANVVKDSKAALSKLGYHIYHLVIMDELFDQSKGMAQIQQKMNTIDMSVRRRICLLLLSEQFQTNDNMTSLNLSVNNILNTGDLFHLDSFLKKAVSDHKNLYTVYNESLKTTGKA